MSTLLSGHLWTLLATALIGLALLGAGRSMRRFLPAGPGAPERLLHESLAGTGLVGGTFFLVGLLSWSVAWLAPVCLALAALGVASLRSAAPALAAAFRRERGFPGWWITGLGLGLLGLSALAEPLGDIGHDGISYHLLAPLRWLDAGRIHVLPDHSHTAFPAIIEVIQGLALAARAPAAAGLLGVVFLAQLLLLVRGLARDLGAGPRAAALATGLAATMPVIVSTADDYFVDIPFAAFALLSLRLACAPGGPAFALAAGAFAGFAGGTKYTGLFVIAAGAFALVLGPGGGRWKIRAACAFGAAALLFTAPCYVRNFLVLGSPIIPPPPGLAGLFPAHGWPPEIAAAFHRRIQLEVGGGLGKGLREFLLLPWNFTFQPEAFRGAHGTFAILGLAPAAVWALRRHPLARRHAVWALALTVVWFLTQQNARFLIHVVALATAACAVALPFCLHRAGAFTRWSVLGLIALNLGVGLFGFVYFRADRLHAVFSAAAAEDRRVRLIPYRDAIGFVNDRPEVVRVLLPGKWVPGYYLRKPYTKTVGQYGDHPFPAFPSPEAVLAALPRWDCSHLIHTDDDTWRVPPDDPRFTLVFRGERSRVYALTNGAAAPERAGRPSGYPPAAR